MFVKFAFKESWQEIILARLPRLGASTVGGSDPTAENYGRSVPPNVCIILALYNGDH